MEKAIRTKKRKKNNIVILISAENSNELKTIKKEFLLLTRRIAQKRELGFYIAPVERASFETIQNFADFKLRLLVDKEYRKRKKKVDELSNHIR